MAHTYLHQLTGPAPGAGQCARRGALSVCTHDDLPALLLSLRDFVCFNFVRVFLPLLPLPNCRVGKGLLPALPYHCLYEVAVAVVLGVLFLQRPARHFLFLGVYVADSSMYIYTLYKSTFLAGGPQDRRSISLRYR